jgi:hypothetical protein
VHGGTERFVRIQELYHPWHSEQVRTQAWVEEVEDVPRFHGKIRQTCRLSVKDERLGK